MLNNLHFPISKYYETTEVKSMWYVNKDRQWNRKEYKIESPEINYSTYYGLG